MAQALIPLKDLVQAKSRLAGLLCPSERRALAQAMVEDVLTALAAHAEITRITLLSDDPGAGMLAARYDCDCMTERELGVRGLNPLLEKAVPRLLGGTVQPLLVLHGDLPLLDGDDVSAVIAEHRQWGGLVIGCDRAGTGTNLLAFADGSEVPFCFGPDSCARHLAAAKTAEVSARLLQRPGIALDVDEPRDVAALLAVLRKDSGGATSGLLSGTALGARLALALETMDPGNQERQHRC